MANVRDCASRNQPSCKTFKQISHILYFKMFQPLHLSQLLQNRYFQVEGLELGVERIEERIDGGALSRPIARNQSAQPERLPSQHLGQW